jgi:polyhydroxyalkanoate synthesis regulator phasin
MPKKKETDDQKAQSERFEKAVQELVDAGELNRTEANHNLERLVDGTARPVRTVRGS